MTTDDLAWLRSCFDVRLPDKVLGRVLPRIDVDELTGCWVWTGGTNGKGYGKTRLPKDVGGRIVYVHRLLFDGLVEPIPSGETVHHVCGNRLCCNPEHLRSMSRADNTAEANRRRTAHEEVPF